MKRVIYILISLIIAACSSENANDCFQTAGKIVQHEVNVSSFEKILVNRDIELFISQGAEQKITIETGENLLNDIEIIVVGNELQLTNNNTCNYVRDYGITKVTITAPIITEIRSSTQYDISSLGVLNYDSLKLISENFIMPEAFAVGDYRLNVNLDNLNVISNNLSTFYISGTVNNLFVGFYAGIGRFEGRSLVSQHVNIFHRGSNDMIVDPQLSISGELRGVGDVIAVNQPPTITLEQFYTGELIFED